VGAASLTGPPNLEIESIYNAMARRRHVARPASSPLEVRIQEALKALDIDPKRSIRSVAMEFKVPRTTLAYRRQGRLPRTTAHSQKTTKLSSAQEIALCRYIDRLDRINLSVRKELVRAAANQMLQEASQQGEAIQTVCNHWVTRFMERHNYHLISQKAQERDRQDVENVDNVVEYFQKLQEVITTHAIQPDDLWNMDKTGFSIGIGRDQLVVSRQKKRASYLGIPQNRESATAVEAISAGGEYIPAFLILSGQVHMSRWYQVQQLYGDTYIAVSSSGYTNDEITLQWLHHFEKHSATRQVGQKRLLLLDGYGSHHTKEFIQYCDTHSIIPFGLPPHTTHFLQPLDIVVFQPLKHYHSKVIDFIV
jgi:hypothetical protein